MVSRTLYLITQVTPYLSMNVVHIKIINVEQNVSNQEKIRLQFDLVQADRTDKKSKLLSRLPQDIARY